VALYSTVSPCRPTRRILRVSSRNSGGCTGPWAGKQAGHEPPLDYLRQEQPGARVGAAGQHAERDLGQLAAEIWHSPRAGRPSRISVRSAVVAVQRATLRSGPRPACGDSTAIRAMPRGRPRGCKGRVEAVFAERLPVSSNRLIAMWRGAGRCTVERELALVRMRRCGSWPGPTHPEGAPANAEDPRLSWPAGCQGPSRGPAPAPCPAPLHPVVPRYRGR